MSKIISLEDIKKEFNRDARHTVYLIAIRQLEIYLLRADVFPVVVNKIIAGAREVKKYDRVTQLNLFGRVLKDLVGDTKLWNHQKPTSSMKITTDILNGTKISETVERHLRAGTEMVEPIVVDNTVELEEAELTKEEITYNKRLESLAKARETKRKNKEIADIRKRILNGGDEPEKETTVKTKNKKVVVKEDSEIPISEEQAAAMSKYSFNNDEYSGQGVEVQPLKDVPMNNSEEYSASELEYIKLMNSGFNSKI